MGVVIKKLYYKVLNHGNRWDSSMMMITCPECNVSVRQLKESFIIDNITTKGLKEKHKCGNCGCEFHVLGFD